MYRQDILTVAETIEFSDVWEVRPHLRHWSLMNRPDRPAKVTDAMWAPAALGIITGLAVTIGWRYSTARQLFDATDRPDVGRDDAGYFFVYDRLQYLGGPSWLPLILVLPLAGAAFGALIGVTMQIVGHRFSSRGMFSAAALLLTGAGVGVAGAFYARMTPPAVRFVAIRGDSVTDDYTASSAEELVQGSPPRFDLGPSEIVFPTAGVALALVFISIAAVRRHRSSTKREH